MKEITALAWQGTQYHNKPLHQRHSVQLPKHFPKTAKGDFAQLKSTPYPRYTHSTHGRIRDNTFQSSAWNNQPFHSSKIIPLHHEHTPSIRTEAEETTLGPLIANQPTQPHLKNGSIKTALAVLSPLIINQLLQAPANAAMPPLPEIDSAQLQDLLISAGSAGGATAWVSLWSHLAQDGQVDSKLSRKIIHLTTAPVFVATWPLFSDTPPARFIAATVPALQLARLLVASKSGDTSLTAAISRNSDSSELLNGPAIYAAILTLATLGWRSETMGLCAITQMAVGDGLADIVGRHFSPKDGTGKLPWNENKSYAGTIGFIVGASLATYALLDLFSSNGLIERPASLMLGSVLLSVACGLIETLPQEWIKLDDNISVPLSGAILGGLIFSSGLIH